MNPVKQALRRGAEVKAEFPELDLWVCLPCGYAGDQAYLRVVWGLGSHAYRKHDFDWVLLLLFLEVSL